MGRFLIQKVNRHRLGGALLKELRATLLGAMVLCCQLDAAAGREHLGDVNERYDKRALRADRCLGADVDDRTSRQRGSTQVAQFLEGEESGLIQTFLDELCRSEVDLVALLAGLDLVDRANGNAT